MRGFSCLLYLKYLGLLNHKESEKMSKKIRDLFQSGSSSRVQAAEKIFKEYPDFFKNDPEKAVFIVGVLSQLLMNIQYRDRKATPFKAKLQGLRLDERKVKSLLPEIQNKLDEYDSNYYRDLETLASEFFIQAQNDWNLSRDEISFYFALGMNLSKYFRTEKEEEKDE
jgi:CRISPR-associated protein Csh1